MVDNWLFQRLVREVSYRAAHNAFLLHGLIEAGPDFQPLAWCKGKSYTVNFFGDEPAAVAWLLAA